MAYQNQKVKARQTVTQSNTQNQTLGIVSEVPMGEWNATTLYKKLNTVRYNGATYIATQDNQGATPTGNGIWLLVNKDGRGVLTATISYQAGLSGTTPPNKEWLNDVPTVPQGQYLWTKTVYGFTDGTTNTSYNVSYQPLDGNGIANTLIAYKASVSGTEIPTGTWSTSIPEVPQGQYLWARTTTIFTNGTQITSYSVSLQGLNFTQQDREDIDRITDAIPSTASADNPLATHDFVNSSINAMAAFYITYNAIGNAFPTKASLTGATTFYNASKVRIPTQNDYATVLSDESQTQNPDGTYPTTRYVYQGGTYPDGQWELSFIVNSTAFTQAQLDALNSGITKELVEQIGVTGNLFRHNIVIHTHNSSAERIATFTIINSSATEFSSLNDIGKWLLDNGYTGTFSCHSATGAVYYQTSAYTIVGVFSRSDGVLTAVALTNYSSLHSTHFNSPIMKDFVNNVV